MKIILVINGNDIELNDQNVEFTEGEQVVFGDGDVKKVESVRKFVNVEGKSADLAYRVVLK